ncbi:nucleotide-diphospho-sugar transferase [Clathrospora elynae]|uniref:Nucleotide-diphospho-sugar transferase n=1 Tax=Clathrospora elynae TaxID=706981 RepID=A0A6A5SRF0_9PLEO|nr:nucleotide-diphospho-sugar transferase [Clathrospora elynae]
MLVKSKPLLIFAFIAATLYATVILYNSGTLKEVSKSGWSHFQDADEAEGIESQTSAIPEHIVDSISTPSHPQAPPSSPSPAPAPAPAPPTSQPPQPTPNLAIATFLTGQASDDTYFNSTRLLVYQLLHAAPTRITNPNITFVVLCGNKLSEEKKDRLRKDGATVIPLEDVKLPDWIHTGEERWSEQFTKLRVFEQTDYKRILYIDADYMIMHPIDDIFEEPVVKTLTPTLFFRNGVMKEDERPFPKEWLFAARSENGGGGGFDHPVPPVQTNYANAGFFLIAPDPEMYEHLMSVMQHEGRFETNFMEQDMLNYVFKRDGLMPWRELDWKWSANFVNERDVEMGVHSLHGKFWKEGPEEVQKRWRKEMDEMVKFHEH